MRLDNILARVGEPVPAAQLPVPANVSMKLDSILARVAGQTASPMLPANEALFTGQMIPVALPPHTDAAAFLAAVEAAVEADPSCAGTLAPVWHQLRAELAEGRFGEHAREIEEALRGPIHFLAKDKTKPQENAKDGSGSAKSGQQPDTKNAAKNSDKKGSTSDVNAANVKGNGDKNAAKNAGTKASQGDDGTKSGQQLAKSGQSSKPGQQTGKNAKTPGGKTPDGDEGEDADGGDKGKGKPGMPPDPQHPAAQTIDSIGRSMNKMVDTVLKHHAQAGTLNKAPGTGQDYPPPQPKQAQQAKDDQSQQSDQKNGAVPGQNGAQAGTVPGQAGGAAGSGPPVPGQAGQPGSPTHQGPMPLKPGQQKVDGKKVDCYAKQIKDRMAKKFDERYVNTVKDGIRKKLSDAEAVELFQRLLKPGPDGLPKNRKMVAHRLAEKMLHHPNFQHQTVDPLDPKQPMVARLRSYADGDVVVRAMVAILDKWAEYDHEIEEAMGYLQSSYAGLTSGELGRDLASQNWQQQLIRTFHDSASRVVTARHRIAEYTDTSRARLMEVMQTDKPALFNYGIGPNMSQVATKSIGDAMAFLSSVLNMAKTEQLPKYKGTAYVGQVSFTQASGNYCRTGLDMGASKKNNQFVARVAPRSGGEAIIHVMGHIINVVWPDALKAARDFLATRQKKPKQVQLNKLPGGEALADNEMGCPMDAPYFAHARNAYAGKIDGSEIIPMGLEALYHSPVQFFRSDPDYAKLVVGVLKGDFR